MKAFLRSLFPLLLGLLASCTVYDNIVHPRRLPTPDLMSKQAKAKFKAAEKARHKGTVLKTEEITTTATDPNAPAGTEAKKDNKLTYSELSEGTRNKYDKNLLIKNKPKLTRRQYHIYKTKPLRPRKASRENRRLRKHPKGKGSSKDPKEDKVPADDATAPEPPAKEPKVKEPKEPKAQKTKEPEAPKESKTKEPKVKKSKKELIPKPDPTQPPPGN